MLSVPLTSSLSVCISDKPESKAPDILEVTKWALDEGTTLN